VTTFVGLLVTTLISDGLQINGANDLVAGHPRRLAGRLARGPDPPSPPGEEGREHEQGLTKPGRERSAAETGGLRALWFERLFDSL
jgi:hypothetical protein